MRSVITVRQAAIAAFFIPLVFKAAMLPMMLAEGSGRDVWIAVLPLILLDALQLLLTGEVVLNGGISEVTKKLKLGGTIALAVPVIAVLGLKCAIFLAEAVNYVSTFLFYNIDDAYIFILIMLIAGFVAAQGASGFGKLCEIAVWIFPVIFILGFVFGETELKFEYVLPVFGDGAAKVFESSFKYLFWACDFLPFMLMNIKDKRKSGVIYIGMGASVVTVMLIYAAFIANYGNSAHLIRNMFATLGAFNVVNSEIGSLEWPSIAIWLTMVVVYLASFCYAAGRMAEEMKLPPRISSSVFAAVVAVTAMLTLYNYETAVDFASGVTGYVAAAVELIIPAVCLAVIKVKSKKTSEISEFQGVTA